MVECVSYEWFRCHVHLSHFACTSLQLGYLLPDIWVTVLLTSGLFVPLLVSRCSLGDSVKYVSNVALYIYISAHVLGFCFHPGTCSFSEKGFQSLAFISVFAIQQSTHGFVRSVLLFSFHFWASFASGKKSGKVCYSRTCRFYLPLSLVPILWNQEWHWS